MRAIASLLAVAPIIVGCAADTNLAMSCSEYIGKPVSHLMARQGPPESTVAISKSSVGYVYTATRQSYTPSLPYYEVNYMTNVENRRTVSRPVTVSCRGTYIALAEPGERQIIVDVWPAR